MYLPLGKYSPDITLGLVSASRNCFPRALSEERTERLLQAASAAGINLVTPQGECRIIETKTHAREAAAQLRKAGVDAVVFFLGNFSPEIEDAVFLKEFDGFAMIIAAAEESADSLLSKRGDALCGLLSAALAVEKRGLMHKIHLPEGPVVNAEEGVKEIAHFIKIMKVVKGVKNATLGLFGPRPRDFETCNYNIASLASVGFEVEELGLFDLENEVKKVKAAKAAEKAIAESMKKQVAGVPDDAEFVARLSDYEKAIHNFRESLQLSGAATQCWSEQEFALKHVPCFINGRMADRGFPIACENDVYSLAAVIFRCLSGRVPFSAPTHLELFMKVLKDPRPRLSPLRPELPPEIDGWVERALAVDRDQRYPYIPTMWNELIGLVMRGNGPSAARARATFNLPG